MSNTQPIKMNFSSDIPSFLKKINRKNTYHKEEMINFKATFYRLFYETRSSNDLTDRDYVYMLGTDFKKLLHSIVNKFNAYHDDPLSDFTRLSYQFVLSVFLDPFIFSKLEDEQTIHFYNLNVKLGRKKKTALLHAYKNKFPDVNNDVIGLGIFTLLQFAFHSKKDIVPFEVFSILIYDSYHYYRINKKHFSDGTAVYKRFLMQDFITLRIDQVGRRILLHDNTVHGKDSYRLMMDPPLKNNIILENTSIRYDYTYSLPLLCHYFGHHAWYDFYMISITGIDPDDLYKFHI